MVRPSVQSFDSSVLFWNAGQFCERKECFCYKTCEFWMPWIKKKKKKKPGVGHKKVGAYPRSSSAEWSMN